jgi:hypothetical protein
MPLAPWLADLASAAAGPRLGTGSVLTGHAELETTVASGIKWQPLVDVSPIKAVM